MKDRQSWSGGEVGGRQSHKGGGEDNIIDNIISREGRSRAPRAHDVEGEFGMGEEAVAEVVRKVGVGGCESGDEVVFGRPHGLLCRVGPMHLWGNKLHRQPLQEKILSAL